MPRVLIGGGPGAGKTTLLAELAAGGHATRGDTARALIAERRAAGLPPRPDARAFAQAILHADIAHYESAAHEGGWVFYERGVVDALGMALSSGLLNDADVQSLLGRYRFHASAFVLPPWAAIYTQDSERDRSFDDAVRVHAAVCGWYGRCGYRVHEVPRLPVAERAVFVLQTLAAD